MRDVCTKHINLIIKGKYISLYLLFSFYSYNYNTILIKQTINNMLKEQFIEVKDILWDKWDMVVAFSSSWDWPCKKLNDDLKEYAKSNHEKSIFILDIERDEDIIFKIINKKWLHNIDAVPTTYVFRNKINLTEHWLLWEDGITSAIEDLFIKEQLWEK